MRYVSTRRAPPASVVAAAAGTSYTFEEAVTSGYAPDGGLFVPKYLPPVGRETLSSWAALPYPELARAVLRLFVSHEEVRTLVVSTTGDTGPAAAAAVGAAGNPRLRLLVHYPRGQISDFQRRQMTTLRSPHVRVAEFDGGGDDMDPPLKKMALDVDFAARHGLCGVNSYNVGRPLAQAVHFVWTYLRIAEAEGFAAGDPDSVVDFVLPTGAMGNITAGYFAKRVGVPIGMLCAGVNANDITHRTFRTGDFSRSDAMVRTLSEAINIQLPYNFERLFYYLSDDDPAAVRAHMSEVESTGRLAVPAPVLARLRAEFSSASVTDDETAATIRSIREQYDYLVDPHTAVAVCAAHKLGRGPEDGRAGPHVALLATASPAKFGGAMTAAIGAGEWGRYVEDGFPEAGRGVLAAEEELPICYPRGGEGLATAQADWEARARRIIETGFSG